MAIVHRSEAEQPQDLHAALARLQQGIVIVIVQNHRTVAALKPSRPVGLMISEIVADLKVRGSNAVMDDDFARDIEESIKTQSQPWNPQSWDDSSL
jgi:hypothetical protein